MVRAFSFSKETTLRCILKEHLNIALEVSGQNIKTVNKKTLN